MQSSDESLFLIRSDELRENQRGQFSTWCNSNAFVAHFWRTVIAVTSDPPVFHSPCVYDITPVDGYNHQLQ